MTQNQVSRNQAKQESLPAYIKKLCGLYKLFLVNHPRATATMFPVSVCKFLLLCNLI